MMYKLYIKQRCLSNVKMDSMTPLYCDRAVGSVAESEGMGSDAFEREAIRAQAQTFKESKSHLPERWGSS
jgi:hypothetical protein